MDRISAVIISFFLTATIFACDKTCNHGKTWATNYITYSFVQNSYYETNLKDTTKVDSLKSNLQGISFQQVQKLVRQAAHHWSLFSNVKLLEVNDSQNVKIRIGARNLSGVKAGMGYFPGNTSLSGDIHMDNSHRNWTASLFYKVILHEMGHSLGLVHNEDSDSVMYYKIQDFKELQKLDIAHLQSLYGAPIPRLSKERISVKWQAPTYKGKAIPYYKAEVTSSHSSKGEVVEVDIDREYHINHYTVKSSKLQNGSVETVFFKASKHWHNLYANAAKNRNQCMRILSKPFIATRNSVWQVERSYIFQESENVKYMVSTDNGVSFRSILVESGSSRAGEYYLKSFKAKETKRISLRDFQGQNIILAIQYSNTGTYWNTKGHGLQIHSCSISDILKYVQSSALQLPVTEENSLFPGNSREAIEIAAHYGKTKAWSQPITQSSERVARK